MGEGPGSSRASEGCPVIPGKPVCGRPGHSGTVFQQCREILEGVFSRQLTGVNEAHEDIAHVSSMKGLVEIAVFTMEHRHLQDPFTEVVVEWGSFDVQEPGEFVPPLEHVVDGLPQARVGLDELPGELLLAPAPELGHHGAALFLVERQPLPGREPLFSGLIIVMVDPGEKLYDVRTGLRKSLHDIHELPSSMGQAVGEDGLEAFGQVSAGPVTHLERRGNALLPLLKDVFEIFSGMAAAGPEKHNLLPIRHGDDPRGEDALARALGILVLNLGEDLHGGVVVVEELPLGSLLGQSFEGRADELFALVEHIPLGGCGNRHPQVALKFPQPVEGHAAAVFEQGHHGRCRIGEFALAGPIGGLSREDDSAQVAPKAAQFINRCPERCRSRDAHHRGRKSELVDLALFTGRARVARFELGMLDDHALGPT